MMITLYGIKNCDTVKKAINWLKSRNTPFEFHDYKAKGISEEKLIEWTRQVGWEVLLNKKGTTWKGLEDSIKNTVLSEAQAVPLMKAQTSLIKRPVIEVNGRVVAVGYDEGKYAAAFFQ
jgi:arsenate reductase (glutaredoxin)